MKVTMLQLLETARERGHNLKSMIALARKFPLFNCGLEIVDDQKFISEFSESGSGTMLDALPDIQHCDVLSIDEIQQIAKARNFSDGSRGSPAYNIPGKKL
jgi:hypothetical protein